MQICSWARSNRKAVQTYCAAAALFIQFGSQISGAGTKKDDTQLIIGIKKGDVASVQRSLKKGANPNIKDKVGNYAILCIFEAPYHLAVNGQGRNGPGGYGKHKNHRQIVELLVKYGAKVNVKGQSGWTPLKQAMECHESQLATFLRHAGERD